MNSSGSWPPAPTYYDGESQTRVAFNQWGLHDRGGNSRINTNCLAPFSVIDHWIGDAKKRYKNGFFSLVNGRAIGADGAAGTTTGHHCSHKVKDNDASSKKPLQPENFLLYQVAASFMWVQNQVIYKGKSFDLSKCQEFSVQPMDFFFGRVSPWNWNP